MAKPKKPATAKTPKFSFRKSYGDGEYTEDAVLHRNGKPTGYSLCDCGGYQSVCINGKEAAIVDTKREGKLKLLNRYAKAHPTEAKGIQALKSKLSKR